MYPMSNTPNTQVPYRLYRNLTAPFHSYQPGHRLWFDSTNFEIPKQADILGAIYDRHNRDDRPDSSYAPSLSVGDLIAFDWGLPSCRFYTVDAFGFSEVDGPHLRSVITEATYREAFDSQPHLH